MKKKLPKEIDKLRDIIWPLCYFIPTKYCSTEFMKKRLILCWPSKNENLETIEEKDFEQELNFFIKELKYLNSKEEEEEEEIPLVESKLFGNIYNENKIIKEKLSILNNSSIDNFHQHYHKIHSNGKKLLKLQYCDIKIPLKLRAELQILIKNILIDLKNNLNSTEEELKIPNLEQIGYFMCETFQIMKKLILTLLKIREIQLCLPVIPNNDEWKLLIKTAKLINIKSK